MALNDQSVGVPSCQYCHGKGGRMVSEYRWEHCRCVAWIQVARLVGPEIAQAGRAKTSPLYKPNTEEGGPPVVTRTGENLLLKGSWVELLPHLFGALSFKYLEKNLNYTHIIISDWDLLQVWLGNKSYKAKSKEVRDRVPSYNDLGDYVEGPDLVIIRLDHLGYKNQAMPGVIKEALLIRQRKGRPTWLVEEPDKPFMQGSRSYSVELENLIVCSFRIIDIRKGVEVEATEVRKAARVERPKARLPEDSDLTLGPAKPSVEPGTGSPETEPYRIPWDFEEDATVRQAPKYHKKGH